MSKSGHRRYVHRRLEPWQRVEVPPQSMKFAESRVGYLEGTAFEHPLRYLLACAYLQGINDCVQAHINNPGAFALGFDPKSILRSGDEQTEDKSKT